MMFKIGLPPIVKNLLIINIVMFLAVMLMINKNIPIVNYLPLYSFDTGYFRPFQLITHMFLHANFGHLFFNMFGLVMFGRIVESVLGNKKFFILYFISGIAAALLHLLMNYAIRGPEPTVMVGASGAVFGILGLFTVMFPDVKLMIIFFPVPIKAKYLMPGVLILELFFGVANFQLSNIAHFAHLGGAIAGVIFALIWKKNQFKFY